MAVNALEQYLDTEGEVGDGNNFFGLVQFLLKQMKLIFIDLGPRRYFYDLLTIAFCGN